MSSSDNQPALRVEMLECQRGGRQLMRDLAFSLGAGELMHLAGANGRGKSTLLKTVCGLRRPEQGRVFWRDIDVHADPDAYGTALLYIGHENAINLDLTPLENLRALQAVHGQPRHDLERALVAAGLKGRAMLPCRKLSAGQRRRVALARLVCSNASLWLLDEPAAALDGDGREWLAGLLCEQAAQGGMVLFSAHEPLVPASEQLRTLKLG